MIHEKNLSSKSCDIACVPLKASLVLKHTVQCTLYTFCTKVFYIGVNCTSL